MIVMIINLTVNDEYVRWETRQVEGGAGGPEGRRRIVQGRPLQMFYHHDNHDRPDNHGDFWGAIWGKMMIVQGWSWSLEMIMTVPHDPALQTTWSSISLSWWWSSSSPSNRVLSKAEKGSIVEFRMGKINKCTSSYSVVLSAPKSEDLIEEEGNILGIEEESYLSGIKDVVVLNCQKKEIGALGLPSML